MPTRPVWRAVFPTTAVVVALIASAASAQPGRGNVPTDTSAKTRVDQIFAQWDRTDSPGCVVGVYQNGRIVYARGYGMANLELNVALTPQSVLDIGSTSKQFTAMSLVLLAKAGTLSLDDDIRKFLPEIRSYGKTITIRHLLNHTSGIRDYITLWGLTSVNGADYTTETEALDVIARQLELNFPPGDQFLYSNSGFFLAGLIVKRASGQTLAEFARDRIFVPLGMTHTRFNDDHMSVIPNRATGYAPRRGGRGAAPSAGAWATDMSNWEQVGDGGVTTTIEDLQRWDENFYTGTVGGLDAIATMHVVGKLNSGEQQTYALGLMVAPYRGLRSVSHGGSWAGYRTDLLRFPDQHFSVAAQCNNSVVPTGMLRRVAEIYIGDKMSETVAAPGGVGAPGANPPPRPAPWTPTAADLAAFAGSFYGEEINETFDFTVDGTNLVLHRRRGLPATLRPITTDTFAGPGGTFHFIRDRNRVTTMLVDAGRTRNLKFVRR